MENLERSSKMPQHFNNMSMGLVIINLFIYLQMKGYIMLM